MDQVQRYNTLRESIHAPGLPYPPKVNPFEKYPDHTARFLPIVSLNYDYLPMNLESPKMFWIDLQSPPPRDLQVGDSVKIHLTPKRGIQTTMSKNNNWNSVFEIDDIVGSRVILSPYKGSTWLPTIHQSCDNPFGWGYTTKWVNVSPSMQGATTYGYGVPVATLEYRPLFISDRQLRFEAVKMEEDWYRGTSPHYPGWH